MPEQMQAPRELIWRVEQDLGITDRDEATRIADWAAQVIEETGAAQAVMHFDEEGCGPYCSWCGAIWGLCGHAADSEWYKTFANDHEEEAPGA